MKGIVLAGGRGTRLFPSTIVTSKQLLPVYDKPLIYYPISTLMTAQISEIMVISCPRHTTKYMELLGDGRQFGMQIHYAVQREPRGIADALLVAEKFIGHEPFALVLGDNIFHSHKLYDHLLWGRDRVYNKGAVIFTYPVADPTQYGVLEHDENLQPVGIEEKPKKPKSNQAITGLYFYDGSAVSLARNLKPSDRGELEISDLNQCYLEAGHLQACYLGRGAAWLDSGTPDSLLEAGQYVQTIERRQGLKIGCIEEVAFRNGWINDKQLFDLGNAIGGDYGTYLQKVACVHD